MCKTSLSFMCCSYSIYFIFYAWCVYSLLSNQFFVIPICLVTFFFFFLLDSPEKYKKQTFSSSFWFPIHLMLPTLPLHFPRCSIFNPKTPHFQFTCSVIMFVYILMRIFHLFSTFHVLTITSTFLLLYSWSSYWCWCYMVKMKSQRINIEEMEAQTQGTYWKV